MLQQSIPMLMPLLRMRTQVYTHVNTSGTHVRIVCAYLVTVLVRACVRADLCKLSIKVTSV